MYYTRGMKLARTSGILLHPTSLPETPGIGTIGRQAYKFVDWLRSANQKIWQILPLGPTGYGDSPYASFSTFAGNPLIIDLDMLIEKGYLSHEEAQAPDYIKHEGYVDFGAVVYWKMPLLRNISKNFLKNKDNLKKTSAYSVFIKENAFWLDDYALFMSIKDFYDAKAQEENRFGAMWINYWPKELRSRDEKALEDWKANNAESIDVYKVIQYFFFDQWLALKNYANNNGVSIVGDIPIFVAPDSADVWSNQHLFQLNKDSSPKSSCWCTTRLFQCNRTTLG